MKNKFSSEKLNTILDELLSSMKQSKDKAFSFYEITANTLEQVKEEREEVKEKIKVILEKIREKNKELKDYKKEFLSITNNLKNNIKTSQIRYREVYEDTEHIMIEVKNLEVEHNKAFNKKNELDLRLKKLKDYVKDSKELLYHVSTSLKYLETELLDISNYFSEKEDILYKIVKASEIEKKSISRDIHDGPAQILASSILEIQLLKSLTSESSESNIVNSIDRVDKMVKLALKETRQIIYDIRPMSLDDLGLIPTLEEYVGAINKNYEIFIDINLIDKNGYIKNLPNSLNLILFRVIQESINNGIKHSKANHININIEILKNKIILIIKDNGVGFDVKKTIKDSTESERFGLVGMKERVELVNGKIKIESEKDKGTKIIVKIPLNLEETIF